MLEEAEVTNNQDTQESLPEINLDNLRAGKIMIDALPRAEVARLWREEYQTLEDGAKEVADAFGWKPKHFFLGKKKDGTVKEYKDWKEFDKEGKEKLPVMQERVRHLAKDKLEADEKIARLEAQIADMSKLQRMQAEREVKKEKITVEAEMQEAREIGDVDKFAAAQERKAQIESEEKILKDFESQQSPKVAKLLPEIILFKANNEWFEKDQIMTRYARALDTELSYKYPNLPLSQRLQMVEDDVKVNFVDKFTEQKSVAYSAPSVESGRNSGRLSMGNSGEANFNSLPEEERGRVERMIKHGIFKSREEYMRSYNADVKSKAVKK